MQIPLCSALLAASIQAGWVKSGWLIEGERLTQRKLGALNLVVLLDTPPEAAVKLLLAGASDPQDAVARRGEELLKKRCAPQRLCAQLRRHHDGLACDAPAQGYLCSLAASAVSAGTLGSMVSVTKDAGLTASHANRSGLRLLQPLTSMWTCST